MSLHNKQWLLTSRATGEPTPEHFKLVEIEVPDLQDGEVLVRHHYLSLDPYMRGRMWIRRATRRHSRSTK